MSNATLLNRTTENFEYPPRFGIHTMAKPTKPERIKPLPKLTRPDEYIFLGKREIGKSLSAIGTPDGVIMGWKARPCKNAR